MFVGYIHKDVVKFEIAMRIALRMHVGNTAYQLLEDVLAGVFWEALVRHLFNVVEDTRTLAKFHD